MDSSGGSLPQNKLPEPPSSPGGYGSQSFGVPTPTYSPNVPPQPMLAPNQPQPLSQQPPLQPQPQWQPTMTQPPQNFSAVPFTPQPVVEPITPGASVTHPGVPQHATTPIPAKQRNGPLFLWIIFIILVLGAGTLATAVVFMK